MNLGILGTGPEQWKNLAKSITEEFKLNVDASVVNLLPADMGRDVWTFKERELNCLYRAACDYILGFQGYKFKFQENHQDIKMTILEKLSAKQNDSVTDIIRQYLKQSRVVVDLYKFLISHKESNKEALLALRSAVNGNFYVNVVSTKGLNSTNFSNHVTTRGLINFLESNDINYSWCDIPDDGFHTNDGHPNADGYKVLRGCTNDALRKLIK